MSEGLSYLTSTAILVDVQEERIREFPTNDIPPEIHALGTAEAVHQPHPVWATLANCRYLLAGVLLAGGGAWIGFCYQYLRHQAHWDFMTLAGFGLVALLCLGGAFFLTALPSQRATVFLYPGAAVIAEGGKLTLIPWKFLLYANGRIWTTEGHKFYCGLVERYDAFEERVWDYSLKHWLPGALQTVQAGGTVTVGPLSVSAAQISYCGKTATWQDVTEMIVVMGRFYQLNIRTKGSAVFHWATINMHEVPNARCMEQLLMRICPEHLLKAE